MVYYVSTNSLFIESFSHTRILRIPQYVSMNRTIHTNYFQNMDHILCLLFLSTQISHHSVVVLCDVLFFREPNMALFFEVFETQCSSFTCCSNGSFICITNLFLNQHSNCRSGQSSYWSHPSFQSLLDSSSLDH